MTSRGIRERQGGKVDQRAALFGSRFQGRDSPSKSDYGRMDRDTLEQQNDAELGALNQKVEQLGDIARGIGKQVKESNSLLDNMNIDFDKAGQLLKGTMNHLKVMMQKGSGKHLCYMIAFVFVLFFMMYLLRGMGKRVGGATPAPTLELASDVNVSVATG